MSRTAMLAAGAVLLSGAATAQEAVSLKQIQGFEAPIHAGTYYAATGQFVASQPGTISTVGRGADDVIFNNNHYTSWFYDINGGTFLVDEGRLPSLTSPTSVTAPISFPGTSNSYQITQIQFAYATDSVGNGTARIGIYNQYDSCSNPLGGANTPILDLIVTGLPGTILPGALTPYTFDVNMAGFEFCMLADGDGFYDNGDDDRFGYAMLMSADAGAQIGPISGARPGVFAPVGDGTIFQNSGAASGSGLGMVDQWFEVDPSPFLARCANAGGYDPLDSDPPFSNFWLVLESNLAVNCAGCSNDIEDNFEQNDDCTSATPLAAPATYNNLVVKKQSVDPDFYRVTIPAGNTLTATAFFATIGSDIDVALRSDDCSTLLDISQSVSDNETVEYFNCSDLPIDVTVEVYVWNGDSNECGDYVLDLALDTVCAIDDALEDNDSCVETFQLSEGTSINLRISECDLDYYDITLKNGESLDITMNLNPAEADLDLFLFNDDPTCDTGAGVLTQAFTALPVENINWTNTTGQTQTYILRVDVFSTEPGFNCTGYTLTFLKDTGTILGDKFCSAELNSTGQGAHIFATGSDFVSANNFFLNAEFLPAMSSGYFITSRTQIFLGNPAGSQGNICVAGSPIGRFNGQVVNTGPMGSTVQIQANLNAWPQPSGLISVIMGDTWNCQYWYRDANPTATSNFTDAVSVTFQ